MYWYRDAAFATSRLSAVMAEPAYTRLACPRCRDRKVVIVTPISPAETVLAFQCASCGFQWVSMNPNLLPQSNRH